MSREHKKTADRRLLKKMAQSAGRPEAMLEVLDRHLQAEAIRKEDLHEELVHCFEALHRAREEKPASVPLSFAELARVFQRAAQKRGVSSEDFYPALLERLLQGHPEGGSRTPPRMSTRGKILEAAMELFSEKGFHPTTIDDIAERAGVGKGTFYRYFANKEALFNELVRSRLEELEKRARVVLDGQDDVLTMITKYLHIYFKFFDENQRLYRLIVQEHLDVGDQVQDLYVRRVMRRAPELKRKIHEAARQGLLKDVDFQTVFYGAMGFVHGVIQKWLAHDCSYSLVRELPVVTEVLFYGFVKNAGVTTNQGGKQHGSTGNSEQSCGNHCQSIGS